MVGTSTRTAPYRSVPHRAVFSVMWFSVGLLVSGQRLHEVIAEVSSNPGVRDRDPAPRRSGGAAARGCRRQGPPALHGAAGAPPAPSAGGPEARRARRRYLAGGGAPRGSSGLATFPRAPSARSPERLSQRSGQLVSATGAGGRRTQRSYRAAGKEIAPHLRLEVT